MDTTEEWCQWEIDKGWEGSFFFSFHLGMIKGER